MDIGTAKPTANQRVKTPARGGSALGGKKQNRKLKIKNSIVYKDITHHLIDIIKPDQTYTVSQYQQLAITTIQEIQSRGKIPFLVGGTGLYIQSVVDNLKIPEVPPNLKIRRALEKRSDKDLLRMLQKLDPRTHKVIDTHNRRRVIRALEVCMITGKPFSQLRKKGRPLFDILQIGITLPKETLHARIDQRVDAMIARGLAREVKKLHTKYLFTLPAMSGIGYKEFEDYFKKKINLEDVKERIKKNTREYAKKQMTWFKKDARIQWTEHYTHAKRLLIEFLKK